MTPNQSSRDFGIERPASLALMIYLQATVPLKVAEIERRGGVTDAEIDWARNEASQIIAGRADALQFGGKPGEAGELAGVLVKALAIMCFTPGGKDRVWEWLGGNR